VAKPGRPAFTPTIQQRNLVEYLAGIVDQEVIARDYFVPAISIDTLHKYFRAELNRGAETVPGLRRLAARELRRFAGG
jgi:hypothetical protein